MTAEGERSEKDWREAADKLAFADISSLAAGTVTMHEMWQSLKAAGFPRYEAMWLTAALSVGVTPPAGWEYPKQ